MPNSRRGLWSGPQSRLGLEPALTALRTAAKKLCLIRSTLAVKAIRTPASAKRRVFRRQVPVHQLIELDVHARPRASPRWVVSES